eukprot:1250563-Pyramimonas_sp.AAC.1
MAEGDLDLWLAELLDKLTDDKFLDFIDAFTSKHCEKFEEGEISFECSDIHAQGRKPHERQTLTQNWNRLAAQNCPLVIVVLTHILKEGLAPQAARGGAGPKT